MFYQSVFGYIFCLFLEISCLVCLDLDPVSPSENGRLGFWIWGSFGSILLVCFVRSDVINVICSVHYLHREFLRTVFCSLTREARCVVNQVYVPVLLMARSVCVMMNDCCKYGDDLLRKMYYHKLVLLFSGRWKSSDEFSGEFCCLQAVEDVDQIWLLATLLFGGGFHFIESIRKNSYRVVDQSSSIQIHPYVCGMLPLLSDVRWSGHWQEILATRDSGYKRFWLHMDSGYLWRSLCVVLCNVCSCVVMSG